MSEVEQALDQLKVVVSETYVEDNDLTEEEWYKRIGLTEENKETTFKGWTEEQINHYLIFSTMRTTYLNFMALKSELDKLSSTLKLLDTIKEKSKE